MEIRMNAMKVLGRKRAALAASFLLALAASTMVGAEAQTHSSILRVNAPEVAITYSLERAKVAVLGCNCFWMQGAGIEGAMPVYGNLSIAGSFSGGHASNIQPGVDVSRLNYLAGPRYTLLPMQRYPVRVFGETLFGATHGFDGLFPSGNSAKTSATAFAMQLGGGVDLDLAHSFAVRLFQASFLRSNLPNGGVNTQNDFRLDFGVVYRFGHKRKE
jgi:hypothetical protein